jgi:hypothetical protein
VFAVATQVKIQLVRRIMLINNDKTIIVQVDAFQACIDVKADKKVD